MKGGYLKTDVEIPLLKGVYSCWPLEEFAAFQTLLHTFPGIALAGAQPLAVPRGSGDHTLAAFKTITRGVYCRNLHVARRSSF